MAKSNTVDYEKLIPLPVKRKLLAILDEFDDRGNETLEPPLERLRILLERARDENSGLSRDNYLLRYGYEPADFPTDEARQQAAKAIKPEHPTLTAKQQLQQLGSLLQDTLLRKKELEELWATRYHPTAIERLDKLVRHMIVQGYTHLSSGDRFGSISRETILEHLQRELSELVTTQDQFLVSDELGDVLGIVLHLIAWHSVSLEDAARRCEMKLKLRCVDGVGYPEGLFLLRQASTGYYWSDSSEHGTGWHDTPQQAFSKAEMERQLQKHGAFFRSDVRVSRLKEQA
jgi:hypothetical protein